LAEAATGQLGAVQHVDRELERVAIAVEPDTRLTLSIPGASGWVSTWADEASSSHRISPPRGVTVRLSGESSAAAAGDS
jgi:hypothetical protein